MESLSHEIIEYVKAHGVAVAAVVLLAGFTACKTVAYDWRSAPLFLIVGLFGFTLSQFVMLSYVKEYLEKLPDFRILFDFLSAYVGSFIVATIIHFVKPV